MISVFPPPQEGTFTRVIGKSQGYLGLAVRFGAYAHPTIEGETIPALLTAWQPTPKELEMLNDGGTVEFELLNVVQHPPVKATVRPRQPD